MSRRKNRKSPVAAICSVLGTVLLVILVLACIPLTVPKVFGYHIYTVISGSMAPAIPTGSLVYIKNLPADDIQKEDVIAFYGEMDTTSIITHRVVSNSKNMGQFITKGDANKEKDMNPVKYDNYIGKVVLSVPVVGGIAQTFTEGWGRLLAVCCIGIAVLLEIVAAVLGREREED
ncbi:MAG: signal peptidase I [Hespellia sp.]|nr:signal peptidase I [Hespellia sp.]